MKNYGLNEIAHEVHQNAKDHGWYDGEDRGFPELIALMHSELSEALEEYRAANRIRPGDPMPMLYYSGGGYVATSQTRACTKPEGVAIELADCIIRILDTCAYMGIDIDEAIAIKHEYNKTRPYRHGEKRC